MEVEVDGCYLQIERTEMPRHKYLFMFPGGGWKLWTIWYAQTGGTEGPGGRAETGHWEANRSVFWKGKNNLFRGVMFNFR